MKWTTHGVFALCTAISTTSFMGIASAATGPANTRIHEGVTHGFLVLKDASGKVIASGEDIQTVHGKNLESRLTFHFKDGSIDDERTVAFQDQQFHLVSDHHIQKGPSFPSALDLSIDAPSQRVDYVKDGSKEKKSEHVDLPVSLSNGICFTIIKNLKITDSEVEIPYLAASSKPRMVKLAISREGTDHFRIAESTHTADRYLIKVEVGGLAGVVAPLLGKQPVEFHVWVSSGVAPSIVRADGPLFEGGPVWSLQLASPEWLP